MPAKHILLLENEKGLERILTLLLKQAKFRVTSCNKTANALTEIVSETSLNRGADLMIIDIPKVDCEGSRLLKQLHDRGITLPVIVITPYGSEDIIEELSKYNSPLFLCSPFEPEDLLGCIDQIT